MQQNRSATTSSQCRIRSLTNVRWLEFSQLRSITIEGRGSRASCRACGASNCAQLKSSARRSREKSQLNTQASVRRSSVLENGVNASVVHGTELCLTAREASIHPDKLTGRGEREGCGDGARRSRWDEKLVRHARICGVCVRSVLDDGAETAVADLIDGRSRAVVGDCAVAVNVGLLLISVSAVFFDLH